MIERAAPQSERHEEAKRQAERFYLLFSGQASPEIAASVLEDLKRYVDGDPKPGAQSDAQAWHFLGQRHLLRWIRQRIERGRTVIHG